ncbi:MAG: ABC transporter substrate-binding protein [Anaerolineae bacterium]
MVRTKNCIVLLVALLILSSGCLVGSENRISRLPGRYKVLVVAPLSGFMMTGGRDMLGGVQTLAGYEVIPCDSEADSEVAASCVGDHLGEVDAIIGGYNSSSGVAISEQWGDALRQRNIPMVSPTGSSVELDDLGWTRLVPSNREESQFFVDMAVERGWEDIFVVYHDDKSYGVELWEFFQTQAREAGLTYEGLEVPMFEINRQRVVESIADPDAVFVFAYETEMPQVVLGLRGAGYAEPIVGADGTFLPDTIEGALGAAEFSQGPTYVVGFYPQPDNEAWEDAYGETVGEIPGPYAYAGAVAAQATWNLLRGESLGQRLEPIEDTPFELRSEFHVYKIENGIFVPAQ